MKKLTVTLLIGAITMMCFPTMSLASGQKLRIWSTLSEYEEATGKKIEKFNEAPMLRTKVAAGELPPVEERLPEEPFVVEPLEEIGQYGGTLNGAATAPMTWEDPAQVRSQMIADYTLDLKKEIPDIFKSYEYSEDMKTLTIHLRKGMKWSDGAPFTADDCVFWWEDIAKNKEIAPVMSKDFMPGGKLMEMEKVDDYTIRLHFAVPYPMFVQKFPDCICFPYPVSFGIYAPKHYLKKWHIKYNPKANELAKKEGYDNWWQAFKFHMDSMCTQQDPNLPTFHPWILKKRTPTLEIFERNPYYHKVDTVGNQLPYIDELISNVVGDMETANLKVISGEIDFAGICLATENYPLYKENEKKGNYRVLLWKSAWGSACTFGFNLNHKDPVLRKIFQDVRFRRAMSLAINRDEINEVVFRGTGVPRQVTILPTASFYKEEWGKAYAQYNPKKADALLDEMGLKWDAKHQYRLRPDGKTLAITIEYWPGEGPKTAICELVKEYWNAVGIKTEIKPEERSFYETRSAAGECDVVVWHTDRMTEGTNYSMGGSWFNPGWTGFNHTEWTRWFNTDGKEGEEPPEDVKELYKWCRDWVVATSKEEYIQLAQKIFDWHAKNVWMIGTVGMPAMPIVVKNNLRNVSKEAYFGAGVEFWLPSQPAQWFFKK